MTHSFAAFLANIGPFGPTEIIVILLIVILLFGAKRLPELAKGMGKSIKEFKKATNEIDSEDEKDDKDSEPARSAKNESAKQPAAKADRGA
ncbi:twin-arginine translocase TatA/TatE family subunit [Congregicoccus parvus]|jgi:sec-independent protein translocase protein TatA|uniref:twin-arginine translocase TatA/TatE family subunit n=1 Tax=Congregicoccus parvus TaxID=3081749 RepID=UPI003FA53266